MNWKQTFLVVRRGDFVVVLILRVCNVLHNLYTVTLLDEKINHFL